MLQKSRQIFWLFILLIIQSEAILGQSAFPQNYFRIPINITPSLSGSFGEIRTNHFHSGIDFRTQSVEGKPVFAAADGFVSRIRVSPIGFGKAIYIDHPNGFTTVYAHVRNFKASIQQYIINEQYKREEFDVDLYPDKGSMAVKKGEIIAWSGNSGSSGGPHLHFEIRRTAGQIPVNPILFGIKVADKISPIIQRLKIYPADEFSSVNRIDAPQVFEVTGGNGQYRLIPENSLVLSGRAAFGIQCFDMHNDSSLKLGIAKMEVVINSQLVYSYIIDEFSFDETRYVNAIIDYEELIRNKRKFIQTRILPNNPLKIYKGAYQNGTFDFSNPVHYQIQIVVTDSHSNQSVLNFKATGDPASPQRISPPDTMGKKMFRFNQANIIREERIVIEMPPLALYEDSWIALSEKNQEKGTFSKVFDVHNPTTPVHRSYILRLKTNEMPERLRAKALIASKNNENNWGSEGGKFENGWVEATVRTFGTFAVMVDTIPPQITTINIQNGKDISNQKEIRIKIKDNLSGIRAYHGTLNGQWVLMDYDPKNELLVYVFDGRLKKGENRFVLKVSDFVGNISHYEAKLLKQ